MTTETRDLVPATEPVTNNRKSAANSLLFGAYAASAVLAIYSIVQLLGTVIHTVMPYVAGGALFVTLTAVFLSIIGMLKKHRKGARKTLATFDTYGALAIIFVMGYFAAACVATFQPGANAADLWSNGALSALLWALLFGGGKFVADTFRNGSK